jgi:large subunit ribosomal protein L16
MGRGKGNVDHWVCYVKPGKILFEVYSKEPEKLKEALKFATQKIPFFTQIITRDIQI